MTGGFSAGDLNLSIGTIADDALKRLDILAERLSFVESSLRTIWGLARTSTKSSGGGANNSRDYGKSLLNIGKWTVVAATARRMGRYVSNMVQAGSDYTETLNLWQVAMRNNLDMADKFVTKMNKAYGISTKTLMEAQATFKNMIGSLGQISDETAYRLSEALVQMSADFSSLYNVQLSSAFSKMQAMLAGQVRPIRSAGLDITESTLFQFYQELGGTKTMRQLNRTEKQLLSILAVYKQMGSAGALGDMTKTLNSFANQSRMMTEYWAELKTWSGLLLKDLIDESGLLIYINAALITTTEIIKAIARSRGIGEENFIDGLFETTEATNDEVDELQGKLLDFDKFRSLEGAGGFNLGIDEKLLQAITGYSSQIDNAKNAAHDLATEWLSVLGFTKDANGEFTISNDRLSDIKDVLSQINIILVSIVGLGLWASLVRFGKGLYTYGIAPLVSLGNAIWLNAIKPMIAWVKQLLSSHKTLELTSKKISAVEVAVTALSVAFLAMSLNKFLNTEMSAGKRIISIFLAIAGAITAAVIALHLFEKNYAIAFSAAAMVAGGVLYVSSAIPNFENGASDIDSGTVFRAGEFGKTEAVYTGSNGKTNVANVQQMKNAELQALNEWWAHAKHDIPAFQGVSDSGIYTIVDGEAKRRGKKFVNA